MMARKKLTYLLDVTLDEIEPPIWREIMVDGDITLRQLHHILQICFNWESIHLYQFVHGENFYCDPDELFGPTPGYGEKSDRDTILCELVAEGDRFIYEYDFGDGWSHTITVKSVQPTGKKLGRAFVRDGERNGASEDSGGPFGYMELLDQIRMARDSPQFLEAVRRLGANGPFEAEFCDLRTINSALVRLANNGGGKR